MTYRIDSDFELLKDNTYQTLEAARAAIERANGGKLYGSFEVPEWNGFAEGWNLSDYEGCATAVIVELTGRGE